MSLCLILLITHFKRPQWQWNFSIMSCLKYLTSYKAKGQYNFKYYYYIVIYKPLQVFLPQNTRKFLLTVENKVSAGASCYPLHVCISRAVCMVQACGCGMRMVRNREVPPHLASSILLSFHIFLLGHSSEIKILNKT